MRKRRSSLVVAVLPWLLALLAVLLGLKVSGSGFRILIDLEPHTPEPETIVLSALSPLARPQVAGDYARLAVLSAQGAGLTGALALVEREERPQRAQDTARQVRVLADRAAATEGGGSLAGVLDNLADALERYAAGDGTALVDIQAASARNAALRERYAIELEVTR